MGATLGGLQAQAQGNDKIIISGASGNLGGLTVDKLVARGVAPSRLILVSRTPDELKSYADRGAAVRFGDFPGQTADIGRRLYLYYMLPFEVTALLLLVAMVGVILLSKKDLK